MSRDVCDVSSDKFREAVYICVYNACPRGLRTHELARNVRRFLKIRTGEVYSRTLLYAEELRYKRSGRMEQLAHRVEFGGRRIYWIVGLRRTTGEKKFQCPACREEMQLIGQCTFSKSRRGLIYNWCATCRSLYQQSIWIHGRREKCDIVERAIGKLWNCQHIRIPM